MGFFDLRALNDDDLRDWCLQRIDLRSPESDVLDYEEKFGDLSKRSVKLELAKDISSFANERGGVLIYGVPEDKSAAVTALLDRLLHHAHILKCGPRSWRTKTGTDLRAEGLIGREAPRYRQE
jgi:hypothetical protein